LAFGTIIVVLWTLRRALMPPALHDALVFLTIAGIAPLATHMRPEMFSVFLFTILLAILVKAERGLIWPLPAIPPLMLLWVNLHGGWLVGIGALSAWIVGESVTSSVTWPARVRLAAIGALALGATLVNPYGFHPW